jgi:hypothetical protein
MCRPAAVMARESFTASSGNHSNARFHEKLSMQRPMMEAALLQIGSASS